MDYHTPNKTICDYPGCEEWAYETYEIRYHTLFLCLEHRDNCNIIEILKDIHDSKGD